MRASSRVQFANHLTWYEKNPIIIFHKHHLTELFCKFVHQWELTCNGGFGTLMSQLRRSVKSIWVPRGGRMMKKVINDCTNCKRYREKYEHQKMGELPSHRIDEDKSVFRNHGNRLFRSIFRSKELQSRKRKRKQIF